MVEGTLDRARLWAAQTPQVFRVDGAARGARRSTPSGRDAATDEAMLVEAAGGTVLIHPAAAENFKVTTPLDLAVAELLLLSAQSRSSSTDQRRGEAELADPEGGAEVDGAERDGDRRCRRRRQEQDRELAGHRPAV